MGLFCIHIVVCRDQFQFLIASFTCTACIFPTESEARALAKERQKKDNHNLSKLVLFVIVDVGIDVHFLSSVSPGN